MTPVHKKVLLSNTPLVKHFRIVMSCKYCIAQPKKLSTWAARATNCSTL